MKWYELCEGDSNSKKVNKILVLPKYKIKLY
jgi:hypothetical protein